MKRTFTSLLSLTVASCKMYFRNKAAIFFTMFVPIAFIGVFGLLSQSDGGKLSIDITNHSESKLSRSVVSTLKGVKTFKITETTEAEARDQLGKGKLDLQVVIP